MESIFTKQHGEFLIPDSRRLRILSEVCDQVDGVITARVLGVNEVQGTIDYEFLDLSSPLTLEMGNSDLFGRVGRVLARMHAASFTFSPEEFRSESLPMCYMGVEEKDARLLSEALPVGWLHSDFWHGNIFLLSCRSLAVIDPLPASFFFPSGFILASGAVDCITLYTSLLAIHPLVRQVRLPLGVRMTSAEAFLDAYLTERGAKDAEVVRAIRQAANAFALKWMSQSSCRLAWPIYQIKRIALHLVMRRMETIKRRYGS